LTPVLTQLLDVFGFLSVLLRGSAFAFESLILGGAIFSAWILGPLYTRWGLEAGGSIQSARRLLFWSAVGFAAVESAYLATDSAVLAGTTGLGWREVAGANFFIAGATAILAALLIASLTIIRSKPTAWLLAPASVILSALLATSHAAGRVQSRTLLLSFGALHLAAAAAWIGGLPYLLLGLARSPKLEISQQISKRFSRIAMISAGTLVAGGAVLSIKYIDSGQAVYGTAYGVMVASKVVLLGLVLLLGACNYTLLTRTPAATGKPLWTVRRLVEAEIGIGFTAVLAAASLSSQPPAVDLPGDRLQVSEIVHRFRPQWPRLSTPPLSALSPATPLGFDVPAKQPSQPGSYVPGTSYHPNLPGDIAWSEYNHHWAGLIVLAVGILALAARSNSMRWARHWPLIFIGLAVFIFFRADPENWPLGPRSFWQSFAVAEVLQHRLFVVLIVAFAGFEWGIATGRIASMRAALVFPAVCALGGALMLTHSHPLGNIKEELLAELSHVPLAVFAVVAGWARWLEIRTNGKARRIVTWIWPVCLILIGAVLLDYRES
jgi:putative copper resistance protein D